MAARTLTVRGVPDATLRRLRSRAKSNRRSVNSELLSILDGAVDERPPVRPPLAVGEPAAAEHTGAIPTRLNFLETVDLAALAEICRRHHIVWMAVFGSHARGDARADSDVDVVVDFVPGMTPGFGIVRVAEELRPVLGNRQVDLVTRRGLAPGLRERVLSSARTLHVGK